MCIRDSTMRVRPSALKLRLVKTENGSRNHVTESNAAPRFEFSARSNTGAGVGVGIGVGVGVGVGTALTVTFQRRLSLNKFAVSFRTNGVPSLTTASTTCTPLIRL